MQKNPMPKHRRLLASALVLTLATSIATPSAFAAESEKLSKDYTGGGILI